MNSRWRAERLRLRGEITDIEVITEGRGICDLPVLPKAYGKGR